MADKQSNEVRRKVALFEGAAAGALFGTAAIIIKLLDGVNVFAIAFWRLAIAFCVLAAIIFLLRKPFGFGLLKRNFVQVLFLGVLLGLHFVLFVSAVMDTTIINATVLVNTTPIWSLLVCARAGGASSQLLLASELNSVSLVLFTLTIKPASKVSIKTLDLITVMYPKPNCWAATFSIVAFDPSTKDLGVAVHSRYFSVGSVVPWAEAEVGAIATQSFVNVSYGPQGLQLLREGLTVNEVIERLTDQDEARDNRQLGIVGSKGNVAVFTGKKCLKWAGSKIGKNYAALGNILAGEEVVGNMGKRFESTEDDLAGKLVAALEGGEDAGGDIRGRQSSSLLVVRKGGGRGGYGDRYIDLRVEDHPNPIGELKRLLNLSRVYYLIDESEDRYTAGNLESALSSIREAISLNPSNDDAHIDLALICLKLERKEEAVGAFEEALRINPKLKRLIKQLPDIGLMERDKELFAKLQIT